MPNPNDIPTIPVAEAHGCENPRCVTCHTLAAIHHNLRRARLIRFWRETDAVIAEVAGDIVRKGLM